MYYIMSSTLSIMSPERLAFEKISGARGRMVRFRHRGRRVTSSKPDCTEDPPCKIACSMLNHTQRSSASCRCGAEARRGEYQIRCCPHHLTAAQK
ncbi:hypothetical protein AVEN_219447-1 [Araneus ventricosus]|uniref:Uncharacterized protein n=1 Tax=Araneus ventricosus TaxID=182803 RepID=A0A4Y2BMW7_ARAVE|nr:hypothetical protein AVEN_219447-1 [Araneus ventricosus]